MLRECRFRLRSLITATTSGQECGELGARARGFPRALQTLPLSSDPSTRHRTQSCHFYDIWLRFLRFKRMGPLRDLTQHWISGVRSRPRSPPARNDFLGLQMNRLNPCLSATRARCRCGKAAVWLCTPSRGSLVTLFRVRTSLLRCLACDRGPSCAASLVSAQELTRVAGYCGPTKCSCRTLQALRCPRCR